MPVQRIEFHMATPDEWVDATQRDVNDEDGIRIFGWGKTGVFTQMYTDIPGSSWNAARLELFRQKAQDECDTRIPRDSLPADHPYIKDGDPALEWLFWDGTDVVERMIIIESLTYTTYLDFVLRRPTGSRWTDKEPS